MRIEQTAIADVKLLYPAKFADERGSLSEVYNRRTLAELGLQLEIVQENHSVSVQAGTLRGLHFQVPPATQGKMVRVPRGAALDVAVDLRRASPTFGRHVAIVLSAAAWNQIWIPRGFAHGYLTLEPDTEVIYAADAFYSPEHERGLDWADPALGIAWPRGKGDFLVAARDRAWPKFADLPDWF